MRPCKGWKSASDWETNDWEHRGDGARWQSILGEYESLKEDSKHVPLSDIELYRTMEKKIIEKLTLGPRFTILVVDDSRMSCKLATRALGMPNFLTQVALSGEAGLTILERNPESYDLVLLDIFMPGLDGIEVLRKMRKSPKLSRLPVAVVSGLEDQHVAAKCREEGAVDVLTKPLKAEEVLRLCQQHYCTVQPGKKGSPEMIPAEPEPPVYLSSQRLPPFLGTLVEGGKGVMGTGSGKSPAAFRHSDLYVGQKDIPVSREMNTSPQCRGIKQKK
ncbi:unnamed protein product [Choristocarpus tenellus]